MCICVDRACAYVWTEHVHVCMCVERAVVDRCRERERERVGGVCLLPARGHGRSGCSKPRHGTAARHGWPPPERELSSLSPSTLVHTTTHSLTHWVLPFNKPHLSTALKLSLCINRCDTPSSDRASWPCPCSQAVSARAHAQAPQVTDVTVKHKNSNNSQQWSSHPQTRKSFVGSTHLYCMRIQSYPLPAHPEAESLSQAEPTNMMEAQQPQQLERVSSLSAADPSSVEVGKKSNIEQSSSSQRNAGGIDDVECDTKVRCAAALSRPRRCSIDIIALY